MFTSSETKVILHTETTYKSKKVF